MAHPPGVPASADSLLNRLLQVDPKVGRFVLAGLTILACSALVVGYGINYNDAAFVAGYLLGFALAATLLVYITNNRPMRTAMCWIAILAFGLWTVGLFDSAFQITRRLPPTPCYLRLPVELPDVCIARLSSDVAVIGSLTPAKTLPFAAAPERLWRAQSGGTADQIDSPLPLPPAPDGVGRVFLQFQDPLTRDVSTAIGTALNDLGWKVQSAEQGGEQVFKGPDRNEVRFFHDGDKDAAIALGEALHAQTPGAPVYIRDFTKLGGYAPEGQLEIWLHSLSPAPGTDG
jgi:hypothetical protein